MTNFLFLIGFGLMTGLLMTRVAKKLGLPSVTAYLVTGVIIGPFCLGRIGLGFPSQEVLDALTPISNAALGFIAFSIGSEFRMEALKNTGKQALIVGVLQAVTACIMVDIALIILHFFLPDVLSIPAAITLGSIATATAPAATLMVVKQYKAHGKVTSILLPVVALDDAVGLIVFSISFGIARSLGSGNVDVLDVVVEPLLEIICSLGLGALAGWMLTRVETLFNSNSNRLSLAIGFVLLMVGISQLSFHIGPVEIGFSTLLVCMMLGTVFCNICPLSYDLMDRADRWTAPLFAIFFVISGANLALDVFAKGAVVLVGAAYILSRCAGKFAGAYAGCKVSHCDPVVTKYLGITLFPQAGVALGMCVTVAASTSIASADASLIRNIVLFSVLVYEIVGPALTKWALTRAGDIQPQSDEVKQRRANRLKAHAAR